MNNADMPAMLIDYWDCEFGEYDETYANGEEVRVYGCTHPCGNGVCDLENKYFDDVDECKLLTQDQQDQQDERKYFVEQTAKDVLSMMADRKLTPNEMVLICTAIAESLKESLKEAAEDE